MNLIIKRGLVAFAALYLSACASPAEVDNMVVPTIKSADQSSRFYKKIKIESMKGGSETNPLWVSKVSDSDFKLALEKNLDKANYLASSAPMYHLSVEMKRLKQPIFGLDMTVPSTIQYTIKDEKQTVVFDKVVDASYTATVSDAFVGIKRVRLANEGSIRENISKFINELSQCH